MNKFTHKQFSRLAQSTITSIVALFALLVAVGYSISVRADYLGTENLRIFPIPLDDILDGYQVNDRIQFVIEVTPRDTGSTEGNGAWSTFYVPPGAVVVDAKYVTVSGSGAYVTSAAEDVDETYNGWGVRGAAGYGAGLGEGFVNKVQEGTGLFYSTDPRTRQQFTLGTVTGTGVATSNVYNEWDRDQVRAFGQNGALSGNGGKGNTPILLGSPNKGTGSPVAGPGAYYTNDYNPALAGNFVAKLAGVGPWQRIKALGQKIGGGGASAPVVAATQQGAITNTSVPFVGGFEFDTTFTSGVAATPLPAGHNAVRIVHGARRIGDLERWSITLQLTNPTAFLTELDAGRVCADSIPADTTPAKDNNWRYYEVSRSCADLKSGAAIVKQITSPADASSVRTNQIITYQFTIYNLQNQPLTNVIARDAGVTNLTLVAPGTAGCNAPNYNGTISTGGTVNYTGLAGNIASWASFTLPANASATFRVCGQATGNYESLIRNEARADYTPPGGGSCGTSPCLRSQAIVPVTNRIAGTVYADLDSSGTLTNSEQGIPNVTVSLYRDANNNGRYDAGTDVLVLQRVTASDGSYQFNAVPSGNYVIVETNPAGYLSTGDADNSTLNCGAGNGCDTIGGGANGTASAIVVTNSTNLTNRDFFDRPPFPDLRIVKSASPASVRSGDTLTFTLAITNSASSPIQATSVVINDVLPAGVTWVSTLNNNGGGTCTAGNLAACNCSAPGNSGTVTCQMGTLAIGQSRTVVVTTTVN